MLYRVYDQLIILVGIRDLMEIRLELLGNLRVSFRGYEQSVILVGMKNLNGN